MRARLTASMALFLLAPAYAGATPACRRQCSCAHYSVAPVYSPGAETVPTNVRLFVADRYDGIAPEVTLRHEGHPTALGVRLEQLATSTHWWAIPDEALQPGTTYELEARWAHVAGGGGFTARVLAGEGPDEVAPAVTAELAPLEDEHLEAPCEPLAATRVRTAPTDDHAYFMMVQITVRVAGRPDVVLFREGGTGRDAIIGAGDRTICAQDDPLGALSESFPGAVAGEAFEIEVIAYDHAGHASEPVVLSGTFEARARSEHTDYSGACCSVGRVGGSPVSATGYLGLAALALAAAGWRRRRPARSGEAARERRCAAGCARGRAGWCRHT